jgi:ribosome-binding protein aMBF1 (putative translation factor)
MKCEICGNSIPETFMAKIVGTIIKDAKGKKHSICFECQKKFKTKEEILGKI